MATSEPIKVLAALPAVHEVLDHPGLATLRATLDHALLEPEALIAALAETRP